jgi:hypothetical protein
MGVAAAALAYGLAACSETTYGTGTSPGMQTLQDIAGIADIAGPKQDPIKYSARPGVVAPPTGAALPPPGGDQQNVATNWPKDPDAEDKQFKADVAAREKFCADQSNKFKQECLDPGFRLSPEQMKTASREPSPTLLNMNKNPSEEAAKTSNEQWDQVKKLFADARGTVAVDENGNPVRRYLTDPPSEYRVPDPSAPVVFEKKKTAKKFRWPWEAATPAADGLTPDASGTTPPAPGTTTAANGGT